jgi:hypothetical protein
MLLAADEAEGTPALPDTEVAGRYRVSTRTVEPAHPVVDLDEKRKQLVSETRAGFVDRRGVLHEDYEYERNGVGVLYMVCEPLGARREALVEQTRTGWHGRGRWPTWPSRCTRTLSGSRWFRTT